MSYNGKPVTWQALLSTSSASAASRIAAQDVFCTLTGMKVATSTSGLFSGMLHGPISISSSVWTGTDANGSTNPSFYMGSTIAVQNGSPVRTDGHWLSNSQFNGNSLLPVYAFSNELTVPEPTSLTLLGIPALLATFRRRRVKTI